MSRHAQPVGADHREWSYISGGTSVEKFLHTRAARGVGLVTGPSAGIRVAAGDVRLDGNVIVGTRTAVNFASERNAFIKGSTTNNVIIGNGVGIGTAGAGGVDYDIYALQ